MHKLSNPTGLLKLKDIIGGEPPLIPVSRTTWYLGMKRGIYPRPIKLAEGKAVAWRVMDIQALLIKLGKDNGTST